LKKKYGNHFSLGREVMKNINKAMQSSINIFWKELGTWAWLIWVKSWIYSIKN